MGVRGRHQAKNRMIQNRKMWLAGSLLAVLLLTGAGLCGCSSKGQATAGEGSAMSAAQAEAESAAEAQKKEEIESLLGQAERLAAGYDYDAAMELLEQHMDKDADDELQKQMAEAIEHYKEIQASLVPQKISEITHVFFHSLVVDNEKAFDGDEDEAGYNQVMTTVDEFRKILQEMYDRGYVLVRLHDMAFEVTQADGTTVMKPAKILLPEGKKAFVMSQDDCCYYPYMTGDGFASRLVVGADGKPTTVMKMEDGTEQEGPYDLVPILDEFIEEHPDFSYHGARAVIAFTGYEGAMGYRTAEAYRDKNPNFEADQEEVRKVAKALVEHGWELASHSWGHLDLGTVEWERFQKDCDKWDQEVNELIGPVDIILFPFGADIGDWHTYSHDNERFEYLYQLGFRYFCNVDSAQYWVQIGDDYMRQGRRNLDGYRMWKDITAEAEGRSRKLEDLFHAEDIFDKDRPTPVPEM